MNSIDKLNKLNKSEFISIFGNIFEKTQWIAEKAFDSIPYNNFDELTLRMIEIYSNSESENHLIILNSHPELAVEKKLTEESKQEQNSANLNQCSDKEFNEFKKLNLNYKTKFGFPFIIAVKGKNRIEILESFRKRINNSIEKEFEEAKEQVKKIALLRLKDIIK
tara:strand:- start:315 stop:809 length:495 start_codon:yes stop_codon:yes gene_type:complete